MKKNKSLKRMSSRSSIKSKKKSSTSISGKKRRQQKENERQQLAQEILNMQDRPPKASLKDVTTHLAAIPHRLEIHPTKSAPTVTEIENRIAREREREKLKFFTVPIKMYEPDEDGHVDLSKIELPEEDKVELDRYGSRVVMSKDGHIAAMEVQEDIMNALVNKKRIQSEFCQCVEKKYDVTYKLQTNIRVRRLFMAKVLFLETVLRLPCLPIMYIQKEYPQLHDFIYQQILLIFFMLTIVQGTRFAGIYFSEVGRYEPCRSIMTFLTMIGYGLNCVLLTALMQQYSMLYIDYKLYEHPTSLETLQKKIEGAAGRTVSYPYVLTLMILHLTVINLVLCLILVVFGKKKFINEMGNGFILVILFVNTGVQALVYVLIFKVGLPYFSKTPFSWDATQMMLTYMMTFKWSMWRYYMLQQLVRGHVMKVSEHLYHYVALNFAI